jgi:hypothetical protein
LSSQAIAVSQTLRALAGLLKAAVGDTQRMIDFATPERGEEIAARWPYAQHWGMEIHALSGPAMRGERDRFGSPAMARPMNLALDRGLIMCGQGRSTATD